MKHSDLTMDVYEITQNWADEDIIDNLYLYELANFTTDRIVEIFNEYFYPSENTTIKIIQIKETYPVEVFFYVPKLNPEPTWDWFTYPTRAFKIGDKFYISCDTYWDVIKRKLHEIYPELKCGCQKHKTIQM